jgi:hypothetical protein
VKLIGVAQRALPHEHILAAGIFQAAGTLTARMSGFGEISARRRAKEERTSSGIAFKRYVLVVVTDGQRYLFDARSHLTGWRPADRLASWDRVKVRASTDHKSVTIRLNLEFPSEGRRLELEAPKARRETSGTVARLLTEGTPPPRADLDATRASQPRAAAFVSESVRASQRRIGWLGVAGGVTRVIAYTMPWVVVTTNDALRRSASASGWQVLGGPLLSIVYPIVIIVASLMYLAGRQEATPRLLLGLGITSLVVFVIQLSVTLGRLSPLEADLSRRGLNTTAHIGFGMWVELVGAALAFVAGLWAYRLWKRTQEPRPAFIPPLPEQAPVT